MCDEFGIDWCLLRARVSQHYWPWEFPTSSLSATWRTLEAGQIEWGVCKRQCSETRQVGPEEETYHLLDTQPPPAAPFVGLSFLVHKVEFVGKQWGIAGCRSHPGSPQWTHLSLWWAMTPLRSKELRTENFRGPKGLPHEADAVPVFQSHLHRECHSLLIASLGFQRNLGGWDSAFDFCVFFQTCLLVLGSYLPHAESPFLKGSNHLIG